jgi:hypothetical protein
VTGWEGLCGERVWALTHRRCGRPGTFVFSDILLDRGLRILADAAVGRRSDHGLPLPANAAAGRRGVVPNSRAVVPNTYANRCGEETQSEGEE